jgi:hypothetical protein
VLLPNDGRRDKGKGVDSLDRQIWVSVVADLFDEGMLLIFSPSSAVCTLERVIHDEKCNEAVAFGRKTKHASDTVRRLPGVDQLVDAMPARKRLLMGFTVLYPKDFIDRLEHDYAGPFIGLPGLDPPWTSARTLSSDVSSRRLIVLRISCLCARRR